MQNYHADNLQKYSIGRQADLAIKNGGEETYSDIFFSIMDYTPENSPEPRMIEDAQGNRTTNSDAVIPDRKFPFSFKGTCEVDKIGYLLYHALGEVVTIQDGATGAYQHTFTHMNNVILPRMTMFFDYGAEGYRRVKNAVIHKITITISDSEAQFSVEGEGTEEDNTPNSNSSVSTLGFTAFEYVSGSTTAQGAVIEVSLAGSPTLTSVKNGDLLVVPEATTGIANASNKGTFIIISADNATKKLRIINNARYTNADDETALTTSTGGYITIVAVPAYPEATAFLQRRNSGIKHAENLAGLSGASFMGVRNFTVEISNNGMAVYESVKSPFPSTILSKNLTISANFTQLVDARSAELAIQSRDSIAYKRAWLFELEDTAQYIGSSVSYRPLLQVQLPQVTPIGKRSPLMVNDELSYEWTLSVQQEQGTQVVLRSAIADYTV